MNCKLDTCNKEITDFQRESKKFCCKEHHKEWRKLYGNTYERKKTRNLPTKEFIMRMKLSDYTDE